MAFPSFSARVVALFHEKTARPPRASFLESSRRRPPDKEQNDLDPETFLFALPVWQGVFVRCFLSFDISSPFYTALPFVALRQQEGRLLKGTVCGSIERGFGRE